MFKGFGTLLDISSILILGFLGLLIGKKISEKIQKSVMDIIGLFSLVIGMQMALKTQNILIVLFSLVLGIIIGEFVDIHLFFQNIGRKLEEKYSKNDKGQFVKAFITTSILFCVGPLAILGPIQDVLEKDYSLLGMKSILDGFTTLVFASAMGIGALFSAVSVFLVQGSVTAFASLIASVMTEAAIAELTGVGGVMVISSGLTILGVKKFKTANMLPALVIAPIIVFLAKVLL